MCGFVVATNAQPNLEAERKASLAIALRGPDDSAELRVGTTWIAHSRLAITGDRDRGKQPAICSSGCHIVVWNGEIYNFREIGRRLKAITSVYSDTQVLAEHLCLNGSAGVKALRGMFAGVVINQRGDIEIIFRDFAGIKPLYEFNDGKQQILASEISAIRALVPSHLTVNQAAQREFLQMRGFFGGRTAWSEVSAFPPGHVESAGTRTRYWHPDYSRKDGVTDEKFWEIVSESVEAHRKAHHSVASLLSGGIDSSVIAAISRPDIAWTVGTESSNEFLEASSVAKRLKIKLNKLQIEEQELISDARIMIGNRCEPIAVPNEILLWRLFREIHKAGIRVVLSGEGADELLGGYDRIFRWAQRSKAFDLKQFAQLYSYSPQTDVEPFERVLAPYTQLADPVEIVTAFFVQEHLPVLLRRLDFAAMQHGVECRVPFVDVRVFDALLGRFEISPSEQAKPQLRRTASSMLGVRNAQRPKVGFPVNLDGIMAKVRSSPKGRPLRPRHGYGMWLTASWEMFLETSK